MDVALSQPGVIYTLIIFLVVISILVFVHEMGHYLAGRLFRVKISSFSIGFGPEILGWTDNRGTRWKISALPLGGYVKFLGDMNASSQPSPEVAAMPPEERAQTFLAKPRWQRAIIVAAGPTINFLFAALIFACFFATYGRAYTPAIINHVLANSAAAQAGLQQGDRILSLGGKQIDRFEDILHVVTINPGQPLKIQIERGGQKMMTTVTPTTITEKDRFGNVYKIGQLGVASGPQVIEPCDSLEAFAYAADETIEMTRLTAETLGQVISGRRSVKELGGPIKIAQFSGQQASLGLAHLIQFMALISINLGFINLLPVPMLDGGHLFLYAIESIQRRPLSPRIQEWAFMSGLVLLLTFMLFVTINDLASFDVWKHLANFLG